MEKRIIASPLAPKAVGTYSQAVVANDTIYVSGQLPIDANTGEFVPGGVREQLHQVFKNLGYVLEEAGYSFDNVAKTTVLLADIADFAAMNAIYAEFFTGDKPARICYQVAALPMGARVEIDAIAIK